MDQGGFQTFFVSELVPDDFFKVGARPERLRRVAYIRVSTRMYPWGNIFLYSLIIARNAVHVSIGRRPHLADQERRPGPRPPAGQPGAAMANSRQKCTCNSSR